MKLVISHIKTFYNRFYVMSRFYFLYVPYIGNICYPSGSFQCQSSQTLPFSMRIKYKVNHS